jgi:hypothetical protein
MNRQLFSAALTGFATGGLLSTFGTINVQRQYERFEQLEQHQRTVYYYRSRWMNKMDDKDEAQKKLKEVIHEIRSVPEQFFTKTLRQETLYLAEEALDNVRWNKPDDQADIPYQYRLGV